MDSLTKNFIIPVLLGSGTRLFDLLEIAPVDLRIEEVKRGPEVLHITFSVVR